MNTAVNMVLSQGLVNQWLIMEATSRLSSSTEMWKVRVISPIDSLVLSKTRFVLIKIYVTLSCHIDCVYMKSSFPTSVAWSWNEYLVGHEIDVLAIHASKSKPS
ncbi:hypothetical protein QVD99_000753 [Batrachochytrium dendrobatidis]|nr:hypothetical protein QVD99_000753 [Batrachochytrium dendrobatidis]